MHFIFVKRVDLTLSILITTTTTAKQTYRLTKRDTRDIFGGGDMSITLTVMVVSWVFAYVQTYQLVNIKYVQFFVYQLYVSKAVFKI